MYIEEILVGTLVSKEEINLFDDEKHDLESDL
jgi:hypothetical protein